MGREEEGTTDKTTKPSSYRATHCGCFGVSEGNVNLLNYYEQGGRSCTANRSFHPPTSQREVTDGTKTIGIISIITQSEEYWDISLHKVFLNT